jgi:hypothetical protein
MKLSPHEMAYLLKWAGIPDADLQIGVAIGIAESDGETDIMGRSTTGANVGQRDHGWLQISGRWNWDKLQKYGDWRNPWNNAQMGAAVYNEAVKAGKPGWSPWSTFNGTTPSYVKWMPDAAFGVQHPFAPPKPGVIVADFTPVLSAIATVGRQITTHDTDERTAFADLKNGLDALHAQLTAEGQLKYVGTITLVPQA